MHQWEKKNYIKKAFSENKLKAMQNIRHTSQFSYTGLRISSASAEMAFFVNFPGTQSNHFQTCVGTLHRGVNCAAAFTSLDNPKLLQDVRLVVSTNRGRGLGRRGARVRVRRGGLGAQRSVLVRRHWWREDNKQNKTHTVTWDNKSRLMRRWWNVKKIIRWQNVTLWCYEECQVPVWCP